MSGICISIDCEKEVYCMIATAWRIAVALVSTAIQNLRYWDQGTIELFGIGGTWKLMWLFDS